MTRQPPEVAALLARSNRLGSDPRNTNYAGGNTSVKAEADDPVTGRPVPLLWVKGSGGDLGTLASDGLAVLRLDRLREHRPSEDPARFWDELEIRLLRSEAEALILYDPVFPNDPFAR